MMSSVCANTEKILTMRHENENLESGETFELQKSNQLNQKSLLISAKFGSFGSAEFLIQAASNKV